jgi:hypothetical protein
MGEETALSMAREVNAHWRMRLSVPGLWMVWVFLATLACVTTIPPRDTGDPVAVTGPSGPSPAPTPVASPGASPSPGSSPSPAASPQGLAYTPDMQPLFQSDCVSCHSGRRADGNYAMDSYFNVMRDVRPGDASSPLVTTTQSRGSMYRYWSGSNRAQKADMVQRWVVTDHAAQTR